MRRGRWPGGGPSRSGPRRRPACAAPPAPAKRTSSVKGHTTGCTLRADCSSQIKPTRCAGLVAYTPAASSGCAEWATRSPRHSLVGSRAACSTAPRHGPRTCPARVPQAACGCSPQVKTPTPTPPAHPPPPPSPPPPLAPARPYPGPAAAIRGSPYRPSRSAPGRHLTQHAHDGAGGVQAVSSPGRAPSGGDPTKTICIPDGAELVAEPQLRLKNAQEAGLIVVHHVVPLRAGDAPGGDAAHLDRSDAHRHRPPSQRGARPCRQSHAAFLLLFKGRMDSARDYEISPRVGVGWVGSWWVAS
eukprot:1173908-Prorocentrum_minimum.AAC.1